MMPASVSRDTTLISEERALSDLPVTEPTPVGPSLNAADADFGIDPKSSSFIYSRVDFAIAADRKLLIYGWILGFSDPDCSVEVELGDVVINLLRHATIVKRPDVAAHFGLAPGNESHGFYALIELPSNFIPVDELKLRIVVSSENRVESRWPVICHDGPAGQVVAPHISTLKQVLRHLTNREAKRLIEYAAPASGLEAAAPLLSSLPLPMQFGLDLCCVVDNNILIVSGWRLDPANELSSAEIRIGNSVYQFLEQSISLARPDIVSELTRHRPKSTQPLAGFFFVDFIGGRDAESDDALFAFVGAGARVLFKRPLSNVPHEARRDLLSLLSRIEAESALLLIERMIRILDGHSGERSLIALLELVRASAVERLPLSIQQTDPRYLLHLDNVISVAGEGIYISGWFSIEPTASVQIECDCGPSTFVISDHWVRSTRTDVTHHLATMDIQSRDDEHGFLCYVPRCRQDSAFYLSVESESGVRRLLHAPAPSKPEFALQTVRALATSFNSNHPELRYLLDRHAGPAIQAAWATRAPFRGAGSVFSFGAVPAEPCISIIVPLYGRYDFAQYQLALFADDPDFQEVELLYVVDDPAIYADFIRQCPDLNGIYRVPFQVIYSGVNLGFAAANNFASTKARGRYLVFLNSDVLPKRNGWVRDLEATYKSLQAPGVLGTKLLYEDGSVQHAGMAFRQYQRWGDLWINDHPFKGQSPLGLSGVHEIDAVTAACAFVDASEFSNLGGFSEDYIIGDFEDSDLCLRLLSAGRHNYVTLDVELYHLERQSQNRLDDIEWRTNLTLYNCWLHNSRWGNLISSRVGYSYSVTADDHHLHA